MQKAFEHCSQDAFGVPLVIQLTGDETTLWRNLDTCKAFSCTFSRCIPYVDFYRSKTARRTRSACRW